MTDSANQPTPGNGRPNEGGTSGVGNLARRVAVGTSLVAGVFSLVICALLMYDFSRRPGDDPHEVAALNTLKAALKHDPTNEKLKEHIRHLDHQLNKEFRRQQRFAAIGGWLLLGGAIVFLGSAVAAATLRRRVPMPGAYAPPPDLDTHTARVGGWAIGILAGILVLAVVALDLFHHSPLSQSKKDLLAYSQRPEPDAGPDDGDRPPVVPDKPPPPASTDPYDPPPAEEIAKWWPRFRGPGGSGHSQYTNVPTTWNAATGENIRWKTPVPLPGNNSPVVWGDRVFLSGATKDKQQVYCFDAKDGKLLWQRNIKDEIVRLRRALKAAMDADDFDKAVELIRQVRPPKVSQDTGYAAPTLVTDGHNVFAIFASGDVVALNFDGGVAWERKLDTPINSYGHAASLAMHKNLVLVQFDQATKKDKRSKFLALNAADGETVWEVGREVPNSWTTPVVVEAAGREQLITSADPWVIAYDPADGKEIWRSKSMRQDVGPSPICLGGVVYVANEFPACSAIRADGTGDVTDTHVLWEVEDGLPDTCSPLATDEFLFLLASYGTLTCYDIKTGELLWEEDFDDDIFTSSPSLVGNRLYLIGKEENEQDERKQKSYVLEPSRKGCKRIAEGALGESCVTSPAFQDGCLYLRGKKHLFCIGKPLAAPQNDSEKDG